MVEVRGGRMLIQRASFTTDPGRKYQQKGTFYVVGPCTHNSKEGMGNEQRLLSRPFIKVRRLKVVLTE